MKKKALCDATQYLHFRSPAERRRRHHKKLADTCTWQRAAPGPGLLGHAPAGVVVEMPHKKPPKWDLTFLQQFYSHLISLLRVGIKYAHGGTKPLRIVADTLRLRGEWVRGTAVACGLHSLRVRRAPRAHLVQAPAKLSHLSG